MIERKNFKKNTQIPSLITTPRGGGVSGVGGTSLKVSSKQSPQFLNLKQEYEHLSVLGTGTFGVVRLVRHHLSGDLFAMKTMSKAKLIKLKQVTHVNSEHDILSQLTHPFIVNLHSSYQDQSFVYLFMDYVLGGELFSHLRLAGKFDNETSKFYTCQVVLAFKYIHSHNMVYRDLKPENLLLDTKGNLRLIDFGFAKVIPEGGRTWTLCGTPEYLAPEIILSKGHGKSADWWALGILIYEMIFGYPPFMDDSPMKLYEKILDGKVVFRHIIDLACQNIILQFVTADLSSRLGNMKEGIQDIMNHVWFRNVDWTAVFNSERSPPIIPHSEGSADVSNFDDFGGGIIFILYIYIYNNKINNNKI
jgi:protein kinase X